MSDPLAAYLHDHLAASNFAIDLLGQLRDHFAGQPLGQLASTLLRDIEEDRETLRLIAESIGTETSKFKDAAGWLAEKASRVKLGPFDSNGLATFEALETLALGVLGKLALWRALIVIAETNHRLPNVDLLRLVARAETQHAQLEESRLQMARTALA